MNLLYYYIYRAVSISDLCHYLLSTNPIWGTYQQKHLKEPILFKLTKSAIYPQIVLALNALLGSGQRNSKPNQIIDEEFNNLGSLNKDIYYGDVNDIEIAINNHSQIIRNNNSSTLISTTTNNSSTVIPSTTTSTSTSSSDLIPAINNNNNNSSTLSLSTDNNNSSTLIPATTTSTNCTTLIPIINNNNNSSSTVIPSTTSSTSTSSSDLIPAINNNSNIATLIPISLSTNNSSSSTLISATTTTSTSSSDLIPAINNNNNNSSTLIPTSLSTDNNNSSTLIPATTTSTNCTTLIPTINNNNNNSSTLIPSTTTSTSSSDLIPAINNNNNNSSTLIPTTTNNNSDEQYNQVFQQRGPFKESLINLQNYNKSGNADCHVNGSGIPSSKYKQCCYLMSVISLGITKVGVTSLTDALLTDRYSHYTHSSLELLYTFRPVNGALTALEIESIILALLKKQHLLVYGSIECVRAFSHDIDCYNSTTQLQYTSVFLIPLYLQLIHHLCSISRFEAFNFVIEHLLNDDTWFQVNYMCDSI